MVWEQGGEAERRTRARAAAYDECVSVVVVAEWRDIKSGFGLRGSVIKHGVYEVVYSHRLSLSRALESPVPLRRPCWVSSPKL